MNSQYIVVKPTQTSADINTLGAEYGLALNGGLWGAGTTSGCLSVAARDSNNEIYVSSLGGGVQIYNSDRTLNRTITGFLTSQISIRFNDDQTLYGVIRRGGVNSATVRVMNTSNDTQAYTYNVNVGSFTFEFNPNNTNLFVDNGGDDIYEFDTTGTQVGSSFAVSNVVRIRLLKRQPNTNRIWAGGDSGGSTVNRLSYFDATTRAITDVAVDSSGATTGRRIGTITGMSFLGSRIFIHHSSYYTGAAVSMMITEIDDTGNIINQWPIFGNQTNYADGVVYQAYTNPVILYARTDHQIIDIVGTLILP